MQVRELNRLKLTLVEKKRTGVWLAKELGVSPITISKWCSNIIQPSLPTLSKIGCEISFNKYFYKPVPLRSLEENAKDILDLDKQSQGFIQSLFKQL